MKTLIILILVSLSVFAQTEYKEIPASELSNVIENIAPGDNFEIEGLYPLIKTNDIPKNDTLFLVSSLKSKGYIIKQNIQNKWKGTDRILSVIMESECCEYYVDKVYKYTGKDYQHSVTERVSCKFKGSESKPKEVKKSITTPVNQIWTDKNGVQWYNGNRIYTGKRGGKYYMNSNGKKTYVK